ncbi:NUDIX domain-containing protein [Microbulbifer sp. SAOS-129_SWC]|uniref:NUDIX domain-containing protein n=1 Tax=Microbulbifer sp. SAOS-129_SWC TaxID=3145235 RepID=UPI003216A080
MEILAATRNRYDGVELDRDALPAMGAEFGRRLEVSLAQWQADGIRVVWLPIPAQKSHLIPLALARGFEFHHCRQREVTMTRRLVPDAPLPFFATHTIGVGGLVISDAGEILTIVERLELQRRPRHFKFPGGMLDPGEHIAAGAVREVLEETGVETAFEGLVSFRHNHSGQFGTSNIYAVCKLRPLTREITIDPEEIGLAQWMPLEAFMREPGVGKYSQHIVSRALQGNFLQPQQVAGYQAVGGDYEIYSPV